MVAKREILQRTVGKGGKAMQFTVDAILKTLKIVHDVRGKKVRNLIIVHLVADDCFRIQIKGNKCAF